MADWFYATDIDTLDA